MDNQETINQFYKSFADKNVDGMIDCYHQDVRFQDPAFGKLQGERAKSMWKMLLEKMDSESTITYNNVRTWENKGSVKWQATYKYGPQKRNVVNKIKAKFKFHEGKIIYHKDDFSMWNWSRQALGISGLLLGWSPFIKKKVQSTTNKLLDNYLNQ